MNSLTPIYDQLALERAIQDPEGVNLVEAIHERQRQRLLNMDRTEPQAQRPLPRLAALMMLGGGVLR